MDRLKRSFLPIVALGIMTMSGCKIIDPLPEYSVEPDPLRVRGDSVEINVNVKFAEKSFHKKAIIEATPELVYDDGKTEFKSKTFQGEDVTENHATVPRKEAKSFSYSDKVAYKDAMKNSGLQVRLHGEKGNKEAEFTSDTLVRGVITTPYLMRSDDKLMMAEDNFQRTTAHKQKAVIHYVVNKSRVRRSELKDDDIQAFKDFVKMASDSDAFKLKAVNIESYASPEGELDLNEDLAKDRASSAQEVVEDIFSENELEKDKGFFSKNPKGEDWEGFKKAMEKSDLKDKDVVIRILKMNQDKQQREKEIRNVAKTYKKIEEQILPDLRRSKIHLHYDRVGKSNEELRSLAKSNPDSLTKEEILKAGSLIDDMGQKLQVYRSAAKQYPNDWRTHNNLGYVLMQQNKLKKAKKKFSKALDLEKNATTRNNRGVVHRINGARDKAAEHFKSAKGTSKKAAYNLGLVNIQNGLYDNAIQNMKGHQTFNVALVKTLNEDTDGAVRALDGSPASDEALGYYLKAIIGARKGKDDMVINNLKSAVQKDPELADKAKTDVEFIDYWDNSEFSSALQ